MRVKDVRGKNINKDCMSYPLSILLIPGNSIAVGDVTAMVLTRLLWTKLRLS